MEKIKVSFADIIVTGTKEKPYYEIKYRKVGSKECSIGYSSYDLNNVFQWRDECFEILPEKITLLQRITRLRRN